MDLKAELSAGDVSVVFHLEVLQKLVDTLADVGLLAFRNTFEQRAQSGEVSASDVVEILLPLQVIAHLGQNWV